MLTHFVPTGMFELPLWGFACACSVVVAVLSYFGIRRSMRDCELEPGRYPISLSCLGTILSAGFVICVLGYHSQQTPEVLPHGVWRTWRVGYHLSLIILLLMITATDLKSYYILTWNCWLGMGIGIVGAVVSGDFQLAHVWVDWNQEIPQLSGPYLPAWLARHPHLHGLAWSVAGLAAGVLLTWLTKMISSKLLGKQTVGGGDVLLMGMIGTYLGWQPTLIAFLIAPVCALLFGTCIRLTSNRPALPYGPFLALGAVIVMFCWRWIWMLEVPLTMEPHPDRKSVFAVRRFFGDWESMLITAGLGLILFVLLLGLLRYYKSLELKR